MSTLGTGLTTFTDEQKAALNNPDFITSLGGYDVKNLTPMQLDSEIAKFGYKNPMLQNSAMDFGSMFKGLGDLFSSEKGGTSVMGGLAPYAQLGLNYYFDSKNDPARENNEILQRQQIASNAAKEDKRLRNDAHLMNVMGTA